MRKGDDIAGLGAAAKLPGKVFHAGTKAEGGKVLTHGGRVLCAVGLGDNVSAAQKQAYGAGGRHPLAGHAVPAGYRLSGYPEGKDARLARWRSARR